jgi:hypothetical protein
VEEFIYKVTFGSGIAAVVTGVMVKLCKFFIVRALKDFEERLKDNEQKIIKMDKALDVLFAGKNEHTEDLKKIRDDMIRIFDKESDIIERVSKMEGYHDRLKDEQ